MPELVRTFVAIPIAAELEQLAGKLIERLRAADAKVKWVEPRHLHWTLQFLGPVDLRETAAVCQAVIAAAEPLPAFDLEAFGAGAFPDAQRPRTVWIGARKGAEEMIALHDAISRALAPLGYREEQRRYRPHLTIGRVRQSSAAGIAELGLLIGGNAEFDGGVSMVSEVTVYSSELTREGPIYDPLGHAELRGP